MDINKSFRGIFSRKQRSNVFRLFFVSLIAFLVSFSYVSGESKHSNEKTEKEVVIAMCRPEVSQIKNIESLYERDLIPWKKIRLIGIYHEDENIDYTPARKYVEDNKLSWVSFRVITGKVKLTDLYKYNAWTEQFKEAFNQTHGIIFTGGWDFPPAIYGQDQLLQTEVRTPVRHYYEVSFLFHLLGGSQNENYVPFLETRKNYAVLGICLGSQTINIACGGTLIQDIPSQVYRLTTVEQVLKSGKDMIHRNRYIEDLDPLIGDIPPAFHRIKFKKTGKFTDAMKMKDSDTPYVLSAHHQSADKMGKNLAVIATSMDGKIVEAFEHTKYKNVLGVQFHPEPYSIYMKGKNFKDETSGEYDFNIKSFLLDNPPSMVFHEKIWKWFSEALEN